jgi:hypothetical protein
MSKQTIDEIRTKGRWTRRGNGWVEITWSPEGKYDIHRVVLARSMKIPRWVRDLHRAATAALGTGGLVEPCDDLWVLRLLGHAGRDTPGLIIALVAEDIEVDPDAGLPPLLRPVWVAERLKGQGWEDRLVEAVQTHHSASEVRWDRRTALDAWAAAEGATR